MSTQTKPRVLGDWDYLKSLIELLKDLPLDEYPLSDYEAAEQEVGLKPLWILCALGLAALVLCL